MENKGFKIIDILKLIDKLQKNVECNDITYDCSKPFLGKITNNNFYNTRPVSFFTRDGSILSISYLDNGTLNQTSVFRVENVDDDFVTVRLLEIADDSFVNTNETAVINTNCICALKCLNDITLNL